MPKARQSCAIGSPSRSCATNRRRSSITEHSFHGIHTSRFWEKAEGVTHVSGTNCHPCLGPLTINSDEGPSLGYVVRSPLGHHADGKLQATWNTRALNIVEMKMGRINSAPSPNLVQ